MQSITFLLFDATPEHLPDELPSKEVLGPWYAKGSRVREVVSTSKQSAQVD
jgi:hypothetical protein